MGLRNMVRAAIHIPGQGNNAHEFEYCPIMDHHHYERNICPIGGGECKFGLTEITPPKTCPLRSPGVSNDDVQTIEMEFSIVERNDFKEES